MYVGFLLREVVEKENLHHFKTWAYRIWSSNCNQKYFTASHICVRNCKHKVYRLEGARRRHFANVKWNTLILWYTHFMHTYMYTIKFCINYYTCTVEETHEVHCSSNPSTEFQNSEQRTAEETMHRCKYVWIIMTGGKLCFVQVWTVWKHRTWMQLNAELSQTRYNVWWWDM